MLRAPRTCYCPCPLPAVSTQESKRPPAFNPSPGLPSLVQGYTHCCRTFPSFQLPQCFAGFFIGTLIGLSLVPNWMNLHPFYMLHTRVSQSCPVTFLAPVQSWLVQRRIRASLRTLRLWLVSQSLGPIYISVIPVAEQLTSSKVKSWCGPRAERP